MSVACPADERECRQLLSTAYAQNHPVTVRYPRGAGVGVQAAADLQALPFGQGEIRREGRKTAILAFGSVLYPALQAGEALDATVVNMRWAKPLDTALLAQVAREHEQIVTLEEGCIMGGAGSAVMEALRSDDFDLLILDLSMPGRHGLELLKQVRELRPKLPILIFSMHPEEQFAVRALRAVRSILPMPCMCAFVLFSRHGGCVVFGELLSYRYFVGMCG